MTNIRIYDDTAKTIEKICDINDISVAELIDMLMDNIDNVLRWNGMKREQKTKEQDEVQYWYFWYDHFVLRDTGEAEAVLKAFEDRDYDTFDRIRKKYTNTEDGLEYFPDYASMFFPDGSMKQIPFKTREDFMKVDNTDYEAG